LNSFSFKLRPWNIADLGCLVNYANNPRIARFMTDRFPHPYTAEAGRAFIGMATSADPVRIFAIDIGGEACGGIGLHPQEDIQRHNAELGYWLAEPFWNKGIISRAIPQVTEYGFRTLPIDRIFARPFGSNTASQRVLEKAGFVLEARLSKTLVKNGVAEDELIYAVRRQP
jgi:ribosomal-protein-alanine N-acetyltransferase